MTQEEKQLLFKDLCARLPYEVKCKIEFPVQSYRPIKYVTDVTLIGINIDYKCEFKGATLCILDKVLIDIIKPYLRPMSSMTEEEYKEFYKVVFESQNIDGISASTYVSDWLISKQFDVRGLIGNGLALEAPEGMYK